MKWNLKNRIAVPIVALIIVITATISLVSFLKSRAMLDKILNAQLNQQCVTGISQVEDWVEAQQQNLVQMAFEPAVVSSLQTTSEMLTNRIIASASMAHARQLHGYYQEVNLLVPPGTQSNIV